MMLSATYDRPERSGRSWLKGVNVAKREILGFGERDGHWLQVAIVRARHLAALDVRDEGLSEDTTHEPSQASSMRWEDPGIREEIDNPTGLGGERIVRNGLTDACDSRADGRSFR